MEIINRKIYISIEFETVWSMNAHKHDTQVNEQQ